MALIPEDKIAEVRDRTDIVQVIGEYVSLRRSGINHKGLCPFHGEKTPSFNVHAAKQMFHCFGCGKSGDVITFLMEMDGKSFLEVVRDLAKRAGIELPENRPESSPIQLEAARRGEADRTRLLKANQLAADYYRAEYVSPRGLRVRSYVAERGITPEVIESFRLGYAPAGWDNLVRFFEAKKVPHDVAERAGLIKARDGMQLPPGAPPTKATHFDLFRDRVMCPVINLQGEVIGFSGRIVDGDRDAPKYINSPESAVFKKGEQLFGLHVAKQGMRKTGRAILVEGNFDVLMMHVHGFTETVAPMGTALTSTQAHLLHRFAPSKVYVFLDGDAAGYRAAARDVGVFLDEDLLSFVAVLSGGEDPDTFLRKNGREACELLFQSAKESVEYFCDHAWNHSGASIVERVKLLEEEAAPILRKVKNETARRRYAQRLAMGLDLPLDTVDRLLRAGRGDERMAQQIVGKLESRAAAAGEGEKPTLARADAELIALLFDHPRLLMRLSSSGTLRWVAHDGLRAALASLAQRTAGSAAIDAGALASSVEPALRSQVMTAALSGRYAGIGDPERALRGILETCEKNRLLTELKSKQSEARVAGNTDEARRLGAQVSQIQQERLGLKG